MSRILYHYCSSTTAHSILQSRTIRLSALSSANDSLEGRVLGAVFTELLGTTALPRGVSDVASVIVEGFADATEGFAFCLSEECDLLSQWRAYARDGTGVSIGFNSDILEADYGEVNFGSKFFELVKVEYGHDALRTSLAPFAELLHDEFAQYGEFVSFVPNMTKEAILSDLATRRDAPASLFVAKRPDGEELLSRLVGHLGVLHFRIYGTKPSTFKEEKEWRLLRYRHRVALSDIEYFSDDFSLRPYIPCLIADPAREAIQEVILGPKNRSNVDWFKAFLGSVGLEHVRVRMSEANSYR